MRVRLDYVFLLFAGYWIGKRPKRQPEVAANIATLNEAPSLAVGGGEGSSWKDIKEHALEQFPKIAFLTIFWIILAGISMALILNNVVDPHTAAPTWFVHYLDERLNIYIPLFEICIYIFLTGSAAIVGNDAFIALSQEEICRFFYNMSAFVSLLWMTLLCFFRHFGIKDVSWVDYVLSVLVYVEGVFVGLALSWFFKYRSSRASVR